MLALALIALTLSLAGRCSATRDCGDVTFDAGQSYDDCTSASSIFSLWNSALTSASFPQLTLVDGDILIVNNNALTSLSFPRLRTVNGMISITDNGRLTSLAFPQLTFDGFYIEVQNNNALTSLAFPQLATVSNFLSILGNSPLLSVSFPALTDVGSYLELLIGGTITLTRLQTYNYVLTMAVGTLVSCESSLMGNYGGKCGCEFVTCLNGGTCSLVAGLPTCACVTGYTGLECYFNTDECASSPCQNGGSCADGVNSYVCACAAGFGGANCEPTTDGCASSPCQHDGVCVDGVTSYVCSCATGFTGTNCETNINECASSPCVHGACQDGVASYVCACAAGFTGATCGTAIGGCIRRPVSGGASVYELGVVADTSDASAITVAQLAVAVHAVGELTFDRYLLSTWAFPLLDAPVRALATLAEFDAALAPALAAKNMRKRQDADAQAGNDWKYMLDSVTEALPMLAPNSPLFVLADSDQLCDAYRFGNDSARIAELNAAARLKGVAISFFTLPTDNSGCLPYLRAAAKQGMLALAAGTGGVVGPVPELEVDASAADMLAASQAALASELRKVGQAARCDCAAGTTLNAATGVCV